MSTNVLQYRAEMFRLNPQLFLQKAFNRFRRQVSPTPLGMVPVKVGSHIIETYPTIHHSWKEIYLRTCDVEISRALRHFLSPGDTFLDIGAGAGYFSALASDIVGPRGHVYSFEPSPVKSPALDKMVRNNPSSNIVVNSFGLSNEEAVHNYYFRNNGDYPVDSLFNEFSKPSDRVAQITTKRLDDYLLDKQITNIGLIKIDVEGYEYFVLDGLRRFWELTDERPPIVCEIMHYAYQQVDALSLESLQALMQSYGYAAYNIFNYGIPVNLLTIDDIVDVVFLPTIPA